VKQYVLESLYRYVFRNDELTQSGTVESTLTFRYFILETYRPANEQDFETNEFEKENFLMQGRVNKIIFVIKL
jgi:hypothetical protein